MPPRESLRRSSPCLPPTHPVAYAMAFLCWPPNPEGAHHGFSHCWGMPIAAARHLSVEDARYGRNGKLPLPSMALCALCHLSLPDRHRCESLHHFMRLVLKLHQPASLASAIGFSSRGRSAQVLGGPSTRRSAPIRPASSFGCSPLRCQLSHCTLYAHSAPSWCLPIHSALMGGFSNLLVPIQPAV